MLKRRKKLIIKLLYLVMCISLVSTSIVLLGISKTVYASTSTVSAESDFKFDAETGMITGYTGNQTDIIIPSIINGIKVTSIGAFAFTWVEDLTSITIPYSVINIEDFAFYNGHNSLQEIIVDSNNQNYISMEGVLFNKSKTKLIKYPTGKEQEIYVIPSTVTEIIDRAFLNCINLKSVTVPDSAKIIGESMFEGCINLQEIIVGNNNQSYTSVGGILFNKSKTKLIKYPHSKEGETYTVPSTVTNIEESAFYNCGNLISITIPDSVTSIGDSVFVLCYSLQEIVVGNNNENYASMDGVLFNKLKTKIIAYPGGKEETTYIVPKTVKDITVSAFKGCDKLTRVIIPSSVMSIGEDAFAYCEEAIFYVDSERVKQLLINSNVDSSKIILNTQSSTVKVASITLGKTSLSLIRGNTSALTATILPSNATNKSVTWKSSNTAVATVDVNGKVTGVAAGSAIITATAKDGSGSAASCKVTVTNPIKVTSIALNKTSLSVVKGYTSTLTATILPSNATNKGVTWKSSNTAVVTVDSNGKITGIAAGSATITCTAKDGSGKLATCKVTVTNPIKVTSIALNKTSLSVVKGYSSTLTASILPSNATNKGVTWKSSNTAVVTVDSNGKITGIAAGSATITCTAKDGSGKLATCKVTVINPIRVTSITLSKTNLSVIKGNTSTLTPTILPSNATNKGVTWKSSNTAVATVDSNGKVTGIAAGSATITCIAKDGSGKLATCKVTVTNPIKVISIALNKTSLSVVKGNTSTLTATILPSNATNKGVTWKSSNTAVATVDSNGKITGIAAGTATITCIAKDGSGKLATCKVTVK